MSRFNYRSNTCYGTELVRVPYKLCLMNLFLHNIGDIYGRMPVTRGDALLSDPGYRVNCVLTNINTSCKYVINDHYEARHLIAA